MPFRNLPDTLTIPPDAGPGDARIVIGGDVPPPLDTYVFKDHLGFDGSAISGIFFYGAGIANNTYIYLVLVDFPSSADVSYHIGWIDAGQISSAETGFPVGYQFRGEAGSGSILRNLIFGNPLQIVDQAGSIFNQFRRNGDTHTRFRINDTTGGINGPRIEWGPGNAVIDTNLFRDGISLLKTDSNFEIAGNDIYSGTTGWTAYTPAWTNQGTATFTSNMGRWKRISEKTIAFSLTTTVNAAGSNVGTLSVSAPVAIARDVRYAFTIAAENAAESGITAQTLTSGSGTTIDRIRNGIGTNWTGANLTAGRIIVVTGTYQEA